MASSYVVSAGSISEVNVELDELVIDELVINYQELYTLGNRTTVSWFLNDTCSESFQLQGYTLDCGGEPVLSPDHVFDVGNSTSFVVIDDHPSNDNIGYKLVAINKTGATCPSTRNIYYRFDGIQLLQFLH